MGRCEYALKRLHTGGGATSAADAAYFLILVVSALRVKPHTLGSAPCTCVLVCSLLYM